MVALYWSRWRAQLSQASQARPCLRRQRTARVFWSSSWIGAASLNTSIRFRGDALHVRFASYPVVSCSAMHCNFLCGCRANRAPPLFWTSESSAMCCDWVNLYTNWHRPHLMPCPFALHSLSSAQEIFSVGPRSSFWSNLLTRPAKHSPLQPQMRIAICQAVSSQWFRLEHRPSQSS